MTRKHSTNSRMENTKKRREVEPNVEVTEDGMEYYESVDSPAVRNNVRIELNDSNEL